MLYQVLQYVGTFLAILIVLPMHEFAHAFTAVKCGDETPRIYGRYTLNPFKHFDLFGLISLIVVRFGWAKPVPINPLNFKHYRRDYFLVSIAGVLTNLVASFFFYPLTLLMGLAVGAVVDIPVLFYVFLTLEYAFYACFWLGLTFFVFNLIPVYPLDGFRVLEAALKPNNKALRFLQEYGRIILFVLIFWGVMADYFGLGSFDVLGLAINTVSNWLGTPIIAFWGLIF